MKNYKNKIDNKILYGFMLFLYLIVLLPKHIQMILILFVFLYLLKERKFKLKINTTSKMIILTGILNIFSICINLIYNHDTSRIFAAFNTASLWILSGLFYSYVSESGLDSKKVNKYTY